MKYHDRIFEIFHRLHLAEDDPGTGVGLALVRKAMGRLGGRVWAKAVPALLVEDNPMDVDLTVRTFSRQKMVNPIETAEDRDVKTAYELEANSYIVKFVSLQNFLAVAAQIELYWCVLNKGFS